MSIPRFHVSLPLRSATSLDLPAAAAHHAARVLRLRHGDAITLFNGQGGEYAARITAIGPQGVSVTVEQHEPVERESPLSITLVQALSSGERMDQTIQKAVELGVRRIVPVASERSVVRLQGERAAKRVAHWQQVVISACEQCGRNVVPEVSDITPLHAWLIEPKEAAQYWMLLPDAATALRDLPRPPQPVVLLIGPEGGLTESEVETARHAGYQSVRLGPRVLRTETAAPALLAAVQALWGDF